MATTLRHKFCESSGPPPWFSQRQWRIPLGRGGGANFRLGRFLAKSYVKTKELGPVGRGSRKLLCVDMPLKNEPNWTKVDLHSFVFTHIFIKKRPLPRLVPPKEGCPKREILDLLLNRLKQCCLSFIYISMDCSQNAIYILWTGALWRKRAKTKELGPVEGRRRWLAWAGSATAGPNYLVRFLLNSSFLNH